MPKPKPGEFSRSLVTLIEGRLQDLRLSIHAAEKRYGFPPETLRSVIRGSAPSVDRFKQICDALGISFELQGGGMAKTGVVAGVKAGAGGAGGFGKRGDVFRTSEAQDLPLVGVVRAGAEIEYWNDQYPGDEKISVPSGFCTSRRAENRLGGVVVRGESMVPIFDDGDVLFFDLSYEGSAEALVGKACIVEVEGGGAMVKRLERGRSKGCYNLESYNWRHSVIVDALLRTARPILWIKKA